MRWFEPWCSAVLLASSLALAQAPQVMPFPLEVKRAPPTFTKEDQESLQREYTRLLRVAGARIPDFARYDLSLRELKRQDCEREDECLAQLAKKAESLYALYAALDLTLEGAIEVTGRVVRDDGKVGAPTQVVKVKEGAFREAAVEALTQLFAALKVGELPATRAVAAPVTDVVALPTRPPTTAIAGDPGAGQRTAGLALLVGGAIGAGAGGALLVASQVTAGSLRPDTQGNLPGEQVPTFEAARTLNTAGVVGLAAGGAIAALGGILWGLAPSAPGGLRVTAVAGPQAAMLSVRGEF